MRILCPIGGIVRLSDTNETNNGLIFRPPAPSRREILPNEGASDYPTSFILCCQACCNDLSKLASARRLFPLSL